MTQVKLLTAVWAISLAATVALYVTGRTDGAWVYTVGLLSWIGGLTFAVVYVNYIRGKVNNGSDRQGNQDRNGRGS